MARRFKRFARGKRRATDWESWEAVQTQETTLTLNTQIVIPLHSPGNIIAVGIKPTITRMLGDIWVRGTDAVDRSLVFFIIAARTVDSTGAAIQLNPVIALDRNVRGVLWNGYFMGDNADARATRLPIDIKAQRILNERTRIDLICHSRVAAASVWIAGRSLFKLT